MRLPLFIFAALIGLGFTGNPQDALLNYFTIEEAGNDFVVTWETVRESDVKRFELHRKTPYTNDEFVLVKEQEPHGTERQYLVRDTQVFKNGSELIDYRLQVVLSDGSRQVLSTRTVNYTPTAIRRTWGSIKAMF